MVGDTVVLDTVRTRLLLKTALKPVVSAPREDYLEGGRVDSATSTQCPFDGNAV